MKNHVFLTGKYKEAFKQVSAEILDHWQHNPETVEILMDIERMLFNASNEGVSVDELFPEGIASFCYSVIEAQPQISLKDKHRKKRAKKLALITTISIICISVLFLSLWYFGLIKFWKNGMWALISDQNNRSLSSVILKRPTDQPYTVTIDLNNLDSNTGKVLYIDERGWDDEDQCSIVVGKVGFTEINGLKQFWVEFKCFADYSVDHATYYIPRVFPTGEEDFVISEMVFEDEVITPVPIHGIGGGGRDYELVVFDLVKISSNYTLDNSSLTLKFWVLDGIRYSRTSW